MEGYRHQGRPLYVRPTTEAYAYQNLYGTVRGHPAGKVRPSLDLDPVPSSARSKKSFNFLPWKKSKSKTDESLPTGHGTLSRHNKYKFGSVSALSSAGLYRDWDSSLSYTPSYSASDLKHASVRSVDPRVRGLVKYPWETYNGNNNNNDVEAKNCKNNRLSKIHSNKRQDNDFVDKSPSTISLDDTPSFSPSVCKCQKKKSGPFGTLNLNSLKSTKCNCGFSSVRSTRGFAPPPPSRRRSILPEKVDLYAVHEEAQPTSNFNGNRRKQENIYDTLSKHSKNRAPAPPSPQVISYAPISSPQSKFSKSLEKCKKDPYSSIASRKSILECDVTAYDLVKSYLKDDSSNAIDSDLDDDLSDNVIEAKRDNEKESANGSQKSKRDLLHVMDKSYKDSSNKSPSPVSSESESGIYSQASSIRIGGHGMKIFQPTEGLGESQSSSVYSDGSKTNSVDSRTSSWSNSSLSDDGIYSLPEPDYDDDRDLNDSDSVLRFNDDIYSTLTSSSSPSLKKYSSGGCLDKTANTLTSQELRGSSESPRFPNVRKATSMVSLISNHGSEDGTLRSRGKTSRDLEHSTTPTSVPPPPPPPPPPPLPPPNFSVRKSVPENEPQNLNVESDAPTKIQSKKFSGNNISSCIASELTEKLKSNQPILKKNEIKPKQPLKVNSHNPYAEVKSILKKTGENLTSSNSNNSNSPSSSKQILSIQDVQDTKKKKRVQFKSLSNESLAVEHIQHQTLSSSDEEWEEARENFSSDSMQKPSVKPNSSDSELRKKNDEDFQTVEEYLNAQKEEISSNSKASPSKTSGEKAEGKSTSKTPTIPRPTQPPPPPPNIRKSPAKAPPPPRPLSATPKSFSHCDLRVSTSSRPPGKDPSRMPGLVKITSRDPSKPGQVSLTSLKGKPRVSGGTVSTVTDSSHSLKRENVSTLPKNGVSSPAASLEATTSPRGKSFTDSGDHSTSETHLNANDSNSDDIYQDTAIDIATLQDDSSSESSYMSLTMDENLNNETLKIIDTTSTVSGETQKSDSISNMLGNDRIVKKSLNISPSITCTIITNVAADIPNSNLLKLEQWQSQECSLSPQVELDHKNPECLSSEEEDISAEIEGPVYSKLLYVPQKSPSPPPLPSSLPPLPPKRSPQTTLTTVNVPRDLKSNNLSEWTHGYPNKVEDDNYDTLPARDTSNSSEIDCQIIYESRRYSDTGATVVTISSGAEDTASEHIYSSLNSEAIYEELPDWSKNNTEDTVSFNPFGRHRGSFFEGASKAEILKFLEGAKERVVDHLEDDILDDDDEEIPQTKTVRNNPIRISNISSSSDSSTISSSSGISHDGNSSDDLTSIKNGRPFGNVEVERADSGVGSETSKPTISRRHKPDVEEMCADCDQQLETGTSDEVSCCPLVCKKCDKKRSERKEIVTEIVETEFKYGKDLMIIKEEFKGPMEVAGLLTKDQLSGIFLNLDELILVNGQFAEKLKDAIDIATEQGDEDYTTVNIGKIFLETTTMLRAFEVYCIRQGSASVLLTNLEKEKELLRIFLRVSQMENTLLRRMNLSAFLMVPVQRVTKYPLLLNRLYKVTPYHHKDREALREAQLKIELHLEQINQQTKGITGTKIWRRISNISAAHRRPANSISDIGSIQLRKMAMEVLEWSKEDIRFVMAGKLAFSGTIDFTKSRRGRAIKFTPSHALLATKGKPNNNYRPDLAQENSILFPRNTGIQDATLLLMKEKNGRYSLARDPLHLGSCVISAEMEDEDIIEIQEYTTKESIFLKAECRSDTLEWLKQLRYHAKDLGTWKRRRNALANIMINGMIRQQ
ncbi:serine-rich adhesin for platelets-like isoform X2 [Stegodyphus dumicola]|nr:serine-rich adhesin for platelets-like isoform X2 [Stegodyphus dumicola]XP_035206791.1 serine-rich adhesin for platelets-like isoform X2 [Stegodyphus dumicola]